MIHFRIPSHPELEAKIAAEILEQPTEENRFPAMKESPLSLLEKVRFQVLKKQFTRGYVPGLPTAVGTMHRIYRVLGKTTYKKSR